MFTCFFNFDDYFVYSSMTISLCRLVFNLACMYTCPCKMVCTRYVLLPPNTWNKPQFHFSSELLMLSSNWLQCPHLTSTPSTSDYQWLKINSYNCHVTWRAACFKSTYSGQYSSGIKSKYGFYINILRVGGMPSPPYQMHAYTHKHNLCPYYFECVPPTLYNTVRHHTHLSLKVDIRFESGEDLNNV